MFAEPAIAPSPRLWIGGFPGATVGSAMVRHPKTCGPAATVADARRLFGDDHVHALLVVEDGRLLSVVERADLREADPAGPVLGLGRLAGRVVDVRADLEGVRRRMAEHGRRRLAVVGYRSELLGLLCLKRSGTGFCSDTGIRARRAERMADAVAHARPRNGLSEG